MHPLKNPGFLPLSLVILLSLCCLVRLSRADETNATPAVPAAPAIEAVTTSNDAALRSNLEIQDQLHSLQMADEKYRKESADTLAELKQQLLQVQSSVSAQNVADTKDLRDALSRAQQSNSAILHSSIAFAVF